MKFFGLFFCFAAVCACGSTPDVEQQPLPQTLDTAKPFTIEADPFTVDRLEKILVVDADTVERTEDQFRLMFDGVPMAVLTDADTDRMRIVAPIVKTASLSDDLRIVLLEANFQSALDARYATGGEFLYAVYIHRLSTLEKNDFRSGLRQVASLVKTFGTTFSSGDLMFRSQP